MASWLGFMRDGAGKEIVAQGRLKIGDEFLEDAGRRSTGSLDRRLDARELGQRGSA